MHKYILVFHIVAILSPILGEDYYEILGVSRTADQREIRRAFKKLAVAEHPDKNHESPSAHERFIRLTRAYETLKDPATRKKYDIYGEEGLDASSKKATYHSWNYYKNNFGIYDDDPSVITLDENEYLGNVIYSEKIWLVNFYSPMCSHCHTLAPAWRHLAKELEGAVRVGAVNCEDELQLCHQIGIGSYPTIMYYPKNSKEGLRYTREKTFKSLLSFVLERLDVDIREIQEPLRKFVSHGRKDAKRPVVMFLCGTGRNCFTFEDRKKIAAVFEDILDVALLSCDQGNHCDGVVSNTIGVIYFPAYTTGTWQPVPMETENGVDSLMESVLEQLPEPRELDAHDVRRIRRDLTAAYETDTGWLVCFYMGRATELNLALKRLPGIISAVQLGKINCARHVEICKAFSVNSYPVWGVFKPGGAFELNHGRNTINDIVKFSESSIKARNVWALSEERVLSILEGKYGNEAWFLDWYAPWCPPCMQFLREVRRASLVFDESVVRFGTVDCTVHSTICQRYGIRSYPTAMLVNGSDTRPFSVQRTATNIIQFVNDAKNPSVVRLTRSNFDRRIGGRKGKTTWLVEYFAPWCGPCQRLAPEWSNVAKSLNILPFVKVAAVDCEAESDLCRAQGVTSYPSIRMYSSHTEDSKSFVMYSGQRDSVSILTWVALYLPRKVKHLDPSTLESAALADKKLWIIDFFAPWCEPCRRLEPQFAIAAQLFESSAQFGRLNCDIYGAECAQAKVKVYPTLMAYDPRIARKTIAGGFVINGTTGETIRRSISDFTARTDHDEL